MKAAVFHKNSFDPRKVVKIKDIDIPNMKENEVLIKVEAAAHNYDDLWALYGEPIQVLLPHISGTNAAGTVIEIRENVKGIKIGIG
jgi:alcohol dehydrogenase